MMNTIVEHSSKLSTSPVGRRSPRLLLIAYNFPPVGGAGVQRPVKWVKCLRQLGWDVSVLTTENPSVPARDESLLADIPDDALVIRTRTWEPDYRTKQGLAEKADSGSPGLLKRIKAFTKGLVKQSVKMALQPDPQVLWVPNALKAGRRLLRELSHDAILVTAPAYSSFFIGTALKRQFDLPLVLDFRDEWDMSGRYLENAQRDVFSKTVQGFMQDYVLKRADAVVATTIASTRNLTDKLTRLNRAATRTETVYNGFDADEFHHHAVVPADRPPLTTNEKRFRLLYTGTLWNLTTIEPLVDAILKLSDGSADLVSKLELVCVGRKTPEQTAILERVNKTGCRLELIDYCEHARVLEYLRATDAVCLLLSDVPGAERVVPAKLFEYLANRKDMLAIVPKGETADIVRRFFPDGSIEPKNVERIADWLRHRLQTHSSPVTPLADDPAIEEFSRIAQSKRLVNLLNSLVEDRRQKGSHSK